MGDKGTETVSISNKRDGWTIQRHVLLALFLREIKARFTSSRAGIFWTIFQPFMMVMIFVLMHSGLSGAKSGSESSIAYGAFLAIGMVPFFLFRDILVRSAGAFQANRGLFIYKQIKPIDTILARILVEGFLSGIVLLIFVVIGYYVGYDFQIKNIGMVGLGMLWLIVFGFGLGLLVAVGNEFYDFVGKIVQILSLPLLLLSGVFFSVETIMQKSPEAAKLLLYNPVLQFMEMIHGYFSYDLDDRYVDYGYLFLWTMSVLAISLWLYIGLERKIISSK